MKRIAIGFLAGIVVLGAAYGSTCETAAGVKTDIRGTVGTTFTLSGTYGGTGYVAGTELQPTGTGVIDPFSRLQNNGCQAGYNTGLKNDLASLTSDNPDEKQGQTGGVNWTHALAISELTPVALNGGSFYQ